MNMERRLYVLEKKVAALSAIIQERLGVEVDFEDEVDKFIEQFIIDHSKA